MRHDRSTTRCFLLYLLLAMATLSGCAPSVTGDHARQLIAARDALLEHPEGDIPAQRWPEAVARLQPERVYRSHNGIYIYTYEFFVEQRGVFLLDPASTFVPDAQGDPSYEVVITDVYLYRIAG
jgi:hypothetical protein